MKCNDIKVLISTVINRYQQIGHFLERFSIGYSLKMAKSFDVIEPEKPRVAAVRQRLEATMFSRPVNSG